MHVKIGPTILGDLGRPQLEKHFAEHFDVASLCTPFKLASSVCPHSIDDLLHYVAHFISERHEALKRNIFAE